MFNSRRKSKVKKMIFNKDDEKDHVSSNEYSDEKKEKTVDIEDRENERHIKEEFKISYKKPYYQPWSTGSLRPNFYRSNDNNSNVIFFKYTCEDVEMLIPNGSRVICEKMTIGSNDKNVESRSNIIARHPNGDIKV